MENAVIASQKDREKIFFNKYFQKHPPKNRFSFQTSEGVLKIFLKSDDFGCAF